MRSTARVFNHPIHPALIPFPFAFLIGSFAFDLLGLISGKPGYSQTAAHLVVAGLVTAVLAATAGAVDYVYTVPPHSSGKKRARRHALFNVGAIVLFALAWGLRGLSRPPSGPSLTLQFVGVVSLIYGSLQGGTLVIRNMISVDHRHAQAGRWKEISVPPQKGPMVVATRDELKEGQMKLVRVGNRRVVLARTDTGYAAFDDGCTHRGASLADGVLVGSTVQCLWHGSRFDCASGKAVGGPAKKGVATYRVSEERDGIAITVAD
ncbi:MAG TPA: Rieske 2Fe-2S domain-containing protein [Vicinamibacterales bacterium]|nr:Rieske 2Fe-2S domain-containing protein [Vicinamibacterales bacterium]